MARGKIKKRVETVEHIEGFTLELSMREAEVLRTLIGNFTYGNGEDDAHEMLSALWFPFEEAGIAPSPEFYFEKPRYGQTGVMIASRKGE